MRTVLILGSGFGGVSTALTLRESLPTEDKILLIDRRTHFMVGFCKTWDMLDSESLKEGKRPLSALSKRGIIVCQANVEKIEPDTCSAILDGERISANVMVVALGIRHAPEKIPGYNEHALNTFGVPPHVAVDVVRQSPLVAADGWIHVDRHTLETNFENVYAIGDCAKISAGKNEQLPKAGLFAEKQGEVVAQHIAARLAGQEPTATLNNQAT